jgi:carbamate kinase
MADASRAAGTVVVALGGNTLLGEHAPWTAEEQAAAVDRTATHLAAAMADGYDLVLTHGNGPQVGNLLLQQERAAETPQFPLDVLVAETQAQIGYLLQRALDNERPTAADAVTLVTQVVVDGSDPAFERPTKPVGPFYSAAEAADRPFETRRVSDGECPFRRVVPSPAPVEVIEREEVGRLAARGKPVICAGGGGVPVVREDGLRGVEAVVDKDRTAALLATDLDADALVVLTDVSHACVDYGTPDERPLRRVDPGTLRSHLAAGEFAEGSMRPKVEACLAFVEGGGDRAVITTPDRLGEALAGEAGTRVG